MIGNAVDCFWGPDRPAAIPTTFSQSANDITLVWEEEGLGLEHAVCVYRGQIQLSP